MIERDAFEARFAAAVLGYAGRVSSEVDPGELAHRIAARDPRRRHWVWAAMALRGVMIPARVWVLLLLAALLTGLVAGALGAGWRAPELPGLLAPAGRLYACPAGSNPDAPGPADQARPIRSADGFGPLALAVVDSRSGRLVAVIDTGSRIETWTFDLCTNTWIRMRPDQGPPSVEWGQLVYDEDSDVTILATDAGELWAYDLPSDSWTSKGAGHPGAPGAFPFWGYDPLTGLVVAGSGNNPGAWSYDVEANSWTVIPEANSQLGAARAVYDASVDRIVFPDRWAALFDIRSGTWSSGTAERPQVIAGYGMSLPDSVYDGAAERTIVIGNERIAAYDATTDRWEVVLDSPDGFVPLPMAYDPVNRRLIGLGRGGVVDFGGVAAFDMVTREWTVLLDAR